MKRFASLVAVGVVIAATSPTIAFTQGLTQTVSAVDTKAVATGYRSSKIVGSTVTNGANETVGKIDDLIITRDDRALVAVISVGGFLGVGSKLVAVPYDQLHPTVDNKGFVLNGVTKESLKALPDFTYAN